MKKRSIKTDLVRLDRIGEADIDYSDIPALDDSFFSRAMESWPAAKKQLTIRLDEDVLAWLKANGRGYQTRINRILRAAMESHARRRSGESTKVRGAAREKERVHKRA